MNTATAPFLPPEKLETDLARVRAYWEGLKRGDATMPFSDDVNPSTIPDLSGRLILIDVFDRPLRFRLDMVGKTSESDSTVMSSASFWMKSMPRLRCNT
jgi:hypothetical protein